MPDLIVKFPEEPLRTQIEPYASIYAEFVVPEGIAGNWFNDQAAIPQETLERISKGLAARIEVAFGHPVHPAMYIHPLMMCKQFFVEAARANFQDPNETGEGEEAALDQADAAHMVLQSLLNYHEDLAEMYTLHG